MKDAPEVTSIIERRITYTVHNNARHEVRVYPGFNGTTTTGPIQVSRQYWPTAGSGDLFYNETLTSTATPHLAGGANGVNS
jgi:hypothetical protein